MLIDKKPSQVSLEQDILEDERGSIWIGNNNLDGEKFIFNNFNNFFYPIESRNMLEKKA